MGKTAIYTAITGGYDTLRQPEVVLDGVDYLCFSSSIKECQVGVWQIRPIPYANPSPIRESRFPKINPHLVLKEYDSSLYVDGNIKLTEEINCALKQATTANVKCAMVKHPERQCTYDEALLLAMLLIGEPFKIVRQMLHLIRKGLKANEGLFVCSIIYRQHNDPQVVRFSEAWWRDYCKYAYRDQLSVVGALRTAALTPAILMETEAVMQNTIRHSVDTPQSRHGVIWHGIHFSQRKSAELLLRLVYFLNGIHPNVENPYRRVKV